MLYFCEVGEEVSFFPLFSGAYLWCRVVCVLRESFLCVFDGSRLRLGFFSRMCG
jgi:hypothetical protein